MRNAEEACAAQTFARSGAAGGATCPANTARAEDTFFRTPLDNFHCPFSDTETGIIVECELREMAGEPIIPRPTNCELVKTART